MKKLLMIVLICFTGLFANVHLSFEVQEDVIVISIIGGAATFKIFFDSDF